MGPGCAFIDYDNDGYPDILLVNGDDFPGHAHAGATTPKLYHNNGNGTFTDVTRKAGLAIPMFGLGAAIGDYDNDGFDDIFITALGQSHLFHNNGNGTFTEVTKAAGMWGPNEFSTSAAWVDYDRDGKLDLVVANYVQWTEQTDLYCTLDGTHKSYCTPESYKGTSVRLWHNLGNGKFEDATQKAGLADPTSKSLGIAILDYNADGWPDILIANDTQPNKLYLNLKNGTFEERGVPAGVAFSEDGIARAGMGVDAADYDRSGHPSIIISNFANQMVSLYHNEGNGLFVDEAPSSTVGRSSLLSLSFGVSVPVVVGSLVAGPVLAVAASLPALRRALRRPVAETLTGAGPHGGYGAGWLDRIAARGRLAERVPGSLRLGFRDVLRQRRRSVAVIAQVSVAAGLAMSFLALGQSIDSAIAQAVGELHFTIGVGEAAGGDARPFSSQALTVAAATPGVSGAQPVETSSVQYNGQAYAAWGLGPHPLYSYRLSAGRWFTAADAAAVTPPVVLGPVVADASGARVGQDLTLDMIAGPVRVRVIGIDTGRNNSGDIIYFPLSTLERRDGTPGAANSLWVSTASSAHAAIDRTATAVASRLAAVGYPVTTTKIYALEAQYTAAENSILAIVEILGLVVVAIMLMGLASALSMGIIERTREIGILRCLGARARHIRRIFTTEAVVLTLAGWAVGILLGWLIYEGLLSLVRHEADLILPQDFQPIIPLITLAGVLVLTLIVIRGPLHRAKRIQPGSALRYQ